MLADCSEFNDSAGEPNNSFRWRLDLFLIGLHLQMDHSS
jgi:hypothetical protein